MVREVVQRGACAQCFRTLVIDRGGSSQARRRQSGSFEGVANGGVSAIPLARGVMMHVPVGTRTLGACAATGMPGATRFPVRWRPTPCRTGGRHGILIVVRTMKDSAGMTGSGGVPVDGSGAGDTEAGKRPNAQLGSWSVRSGWSKGELASSQVKPQARQMGAHHISTDTSGCGAGSTASSRASRSRASSPSLVLRALRRGGRRRGAQGCAPRTSHPRWPASTCPGRARRPSPCSASSPAAT
ncbi:hypothetical protein SCYAM73S_02540 [Streptomyces cyaneofuscatus]